MLATRRPGQKLSPLTMTDADWDDLVGLAHEPTGTVASVAADLPSSGVSIGNLIDIAERTWSIPPGTGLQAFFQGRNVRFTTRVVVNHNVGGGLRVCDSEMFITNANMSPNQVNGGAFGDTSMAISRCDLTSTIDGFWPGDGTQDGIPSVIELTRLRGPGRTLYRGYPLLPSNIPVTVTGPTGTYARIATVAELDASVQIAASTVYTAGQLIWTANGELYQVSVGGTSGSGTVGSGPWWQAWIGGSQNADQTMFKDLPLGATSQPFSDGPNTLQLVQIGDFYHGDGIQIARAGRIDLRYLKVSGFSNSCIFIQSSAQSYDFGQNPPGPIRIHHCDLQPNDNQWIYAYAPQYDPTGNTNGGASVQAGRYTRSAGGAWTANATPWTGRPEMLTVTDNLLRDRTSLGTNWSTLQPTFQPGTFYGGIWSALNVASLNGSGAGAPAGDYPMFFRTEAERQAAIGRQWQSAGVIDTTVLETRWQAGLFPGACDARSGIVWARNVDQRGAVLNPTYRQSVTSFDAQGYYIGS